MDSSGILRYKIGESMGSLCQNIQFSVRGLTGNLASTSKIATELICWVISNTSFFMWRVPAHVCSAISMPSFAFNFYFKENKSALRPGTSKAAVLILGSTYIFQLGSV